MVGRIGVALFLACTCTVSAAEPQSTPSPDSLVAYWLARGALANWQPHKLFTGCPRLAAWQKRGIDLLLAARLSTERASDLANAWASPLKECRDTRLEHWYFKRIEAASVGGESAETLVKYWWALQDADSPAIRQFLRDMMLNTTKPQGYRNNAGVTLFSRLGTRERLAEYLKAFETKHMPNEVAWGQTEIIGKGDADLLIREVGARVRVNPSLADQDAFRQLVQSVSTRASRAGRRDLESAIEEGLNRSNLGSRERSELEASAHILKAADD